MARFLLADSDYGRHTLSRYSVKKHFPDDGVVMCASDPMAIASLTREGPFDFVITDLTKDVGRGLLTHMATTGNKTPVAIYSHVRPNDIRTILSAAGSDSARNHIFEKNTRFIDVVAFMRERYTPGARPTGGDILPLPAPSAG